MPRKLGNTGPGESAILSYLVLHWTPVFQHLFLCSIWGSRPNGLFYGYQSCQPEYPCRAGTTGCPYPAFKISCPMDIAKSSLWAPPAKSTMHLLYFRSFEQYTVPRFPVDLLRESCTLTCSPILREYYSLGDHYSIPLCGLRRVLTVS